MLPRSSRKAVAIHQRSPHKAASSCLRRDVDQHVILAPSTLRSQATRDRARRGVKRIVIEVDTRLPDALVDAGLLGEWDSEDWDAITAVVQKFIGDFVRPDE